MLLGKFIYQMSSWTRAIAISLSIVHAHNPRRPVPAGFSLEELFLPGVPRGFQRDAKWFTWRNLFQLAQLGTTRPIAKFAFSCSNRPFNDLQQGDMA